MKNYTDTRDAIFEELYELAKLDKNVMIVTGDTGAFIFNEFKKNLPGQFYNFGIAEANMISVAAGLALEGKKVFVYGISNFVTLRCLEQIRVDVCGMNLPVTILGTGTGFTYSSDGLTHHITEDVSCMRALPNMEILNASTYNMCADFTKYAYHSNHPIYLRFDKGPFKHTYESIDMGDGFHVTPGSGDEDKVIIATGTMVDTAIEASKGKHTVIDLFKLKGFDGGKLSQQLLNAKTVYTLEEHNFIGGLYSTICELVCLYGLTTRIIPFAINDKFTYAVGDREYMKRIEGLDAKYISMVIG